MQGVSGASSKGAKGGFGGIPINTVEQSGGTATNNSFSLRAKLLVVREDGGQREQPSKQIDPALLARVAIEEELKRKGGGGGGGGMQSFNPNMWVSYSYKLMNEAMQQLYDLLNQALSQGLGQSSNVANNIGAQVANAFANIFNPAVIPVRNFFVQLQKDSSNLVKTFLNNPLEASFKLASNSMQIATIIFSAVINGLKKAIYGKDEEKLDPDEEIYVTEEKVFPRMLGLRALQDEDNETTGKSMKAHLDNLAKQFNDWVNSFRR